MRCPQCGTENLDGLDQCESCASDLRAMDIPLPRDALTELLLEGHIQEIATPDPIAVRPDDSLNRALERMRHYNVRALLVMEGVRLTGILSETDIIRKLQPGEAGDEYLVRDLMTADPVVVKPEDSVGTAMHRMCIEGVHWLPVIQGERVVGIVGMRDVLHRLVPTLLEANDA